MLINLIASVCFAFHKLLISMKSKHPFSQDGKSHILSLFQNGLSFSCH